MIDEPQQPQWRISFHSLGRRCGHRAVFRDDGFTGISKCLLMPFTHFAESGHLNKWFEEFISRCYKESWPFLLFVAVVNYMDGEEPRILELT